MNEWKREKLALLEELLGFMEKRGLEQRSDESQWDACPSCGAVNDVSGEIIDHEPTCRDTARRAELGRQIAELKKELGI